MINRNDPEFCLKAALFLGVLVGGTLMAMLLIKKARHA